MDPVLKNTEHHVLIIDDGNQRRVLQLDAVAYSVGRDPSNAIILTSDPAISRQHALLIRLPVPNKGYRYRLLDGNSTGKRSANGIFINGTRQTMHELVKGDRIRFGKNVQATYLRVAMGEAEFVNYLEGLSYQSLKSGVTDAKATLVSPDALGLDEYLMQTMIFAAPPKTAAVKSEPTPVNPLQPAPTQPTAQVALVTPPPEPKTEETTVLTGPAAKNIHPPTVNPTPAPQTSPEPTVAMTPSTVPKSEQPVTPPPATSEQPTPKHTPSPEDQQPLIQGYQQTSEKPLEKTHLPQQPTEKSPAQQQTTGKLQENSPALERPTQRPTWQPWMSVAFGSVMGGVIVMGLLSITLLSVFSASTVSPENPSLEKTIEKESSQPRSF